MNTKELVCIGCPVGCQLQVKREGEDVISVIGNTCRKGEAYAKKECSNPTRILTSTVYVRDGELKVLPVKTESDIPKEKIFDCIKALKGIIVKAPINIGDVVIENIVGTGVNIIATKKVNRVNKRIHKIA